MRKPQTLDHDEEGGVPVVSPGRTPSPSVAQGSRQTAVSIFSGPSRTTASRPATGATTLDPFRWRGVLRGEPPEVGQSNRSCEPECRVAGDRYCIGPAARSILRISGEDSFNDLHSYRSHSYRPIAIASNLSANRLMLSAIHREGLDAGQPQPWSKIANLPSQESAVE